MAGRYGLEAGKYVLFLGRLVPEKRPDWLVRAFRETARPTDGLKLVLAGGSSGTDGYVRSLKALAGDDPRIVFTGVVQGDDKRELLGNARLFVLPSRLEGHPIALLEAWAYGLGCLTSDIEPFRVAVRDGVDGIMFRNDDYDDFRAKLSGCLRASERLWEMGRLARERAAAHPDWPTVIEATRALYGSVGGRSPR
jgi:glycosyltransferase involved in cell wall biosynthesis